MLSAQRTYRQSGRFLMLFILYVVALEMNEPHYVNLPEGLFILYALGFTLDKVAAMQEHGMKGQLIRTPT